MNSITTGLQRRSAASATALLFAVSIAFAQQPAQQASATSFPERPVRLLVGYSAGGGVDAMARLIAVHLARPLGQQVIVENRAGASGTIAGAAVAAAAPDGYTLFMGDSATLIAQHLQPKMSFDPVSGFAPVAGLFRMPLMIIAGSDFPAKTPKELVAALEAKPGFYSFATSGVGTVQHLGFELLEGRTGTKALHVPYRGAAQIVPDVIGGQVPLGVVSATAGMAQARAGKVRALALMSDDKLPGAEDVAPLSSAVPGLDVAPRLFLLAPAGTPAAVVQRLETAVQGMMETPEVAQTAAAQGAVIRFMPASELGNSMAQESVRWGEVIREQKITPQ